MVLVMFRSFSSPAIVLRKNRVGEIHKGLSLLTPKLGLVSAIAHGAYKMKSRLRLASEPFGYVKVYLYHDPVKEQFKVTDLESIDLFECIRASVAKFFTASLWAETVLKSFGGGDSSRDLFRLLRDALCVLDTSPAGTETRVSVQFLIRFLSLSGYAPDLEGCSLCDRRIEETEALVLKQGGLELVCSGCAGSGAPGLPLSSGGRRYLSVTRGMSLEKAVKVGLEATGMTALKALLYDYLQSALDTRLKTLQAGPGIL
jgi:DNA repair protein RecO (recombination protein O)